MYTPPPLYRSIHCIDLFLVSYDLLSMHTLPDVYIINEVKGYFHFRFDEILSKMHVVNTHLCLIWIILTNLLQIFKKNNILTKRSKLTKAYMVIWCWENMSSAVGRIYECQGHLLHFSKIWKASAAFYECMVFFAKIFRRTLQKFGIVPVLVFTLQEEPQAKNIHILYDWANSQRAFKAIQMIIKNRQKSKL